ncbi:MAG: hypothetical protein PHD43_24000 [Methylococcales bacterium]|nr:hypothetical protein [Methylococcales bacterium]
MVSSQSLAQRVSECARALFATANRALTRVLAIQEAEALMVDHEFTVTSVQVLTLTDSSNCSAYDCEFVALAKQLSVKLVTQDKKILLEFPEVAVSLDDFLN